MDLPTYISDLNRRKLLAQHIGHSPDYLYQLGTGYQGRKPSPTLAGVIENATRDLKLGIVRAESMRDDHQFQRDRSGRVTGYARLLKAG